MTASFSENVIELYQPTPRTSITRASRRMSTAPCSTGAVLKWCYILPMTREAAAERLGCAGASEPS